MDGFVQDVLVPLLAAVGGGAGLLKIGSAIAGWRKGVRQREDDKDERYATRLENELAAVKAELTAARAYIETLLVYIARSGGDPPVRP